MNILIKTTAFLIFTMMCVLSNQILAQDRHIEMLAGLLKPPFVIPQDDKGMQIEIIEAAFALTNDHVSFIYLPLSRHMDVYQKRHVEGLITLSESETTLGLHLSKPYITYQNVIVTLATQKFEINKLADLSEKRVAAFQNAIKFLGEDYNNAFVNSNSYIELADQKSQLSLLFTGRVDAIVIDINIFKHLQVLLAKESFDTLYHQKVVEHHVFKQRQYVAGFNSIELRDIFDKGIAEIKRNGRYQQIIDSYLK